MTFTDKKNIIELLNKNWMTHDGIWFYHCLQAFGIEKTNQLNKMAISALAPIEIKRLKQFSNMEGEPINTMDTFRQFFNRANELFIPDFMNVSLRFDGANGMHWDFSPNNCFAYKGMVAAGVIDQYECGVIFRIECWIKSLGIRYTVSPEITRWQLQRHLSFTHVIFYEYFSDHSLVYFQQKKCYFFYLLKSCKSVNHIICVNNIYILFYTAFYPNLSKRDIRFHETGH